MFWSACSSEEIQEHDTPVNKKVTASKSRLIQAKFQRYGYLSSADVSPEKDATRAEARLATYTRKHSIKHLEAWTSRSLQQQLA